MASVAVERHHVRVGNERSRFAGGDQAYLKDEQYGTTARLAARTNLHLRYGTATEPWFEWVHRTAELPEGTEVLEVGCGEGRLWEASPSALARVRLTLLDVSAAMVGAALGRAPSARGGVADVQRLPFPDASFDAVLANHMLYHASDPAAAVLELARALRPDGRLIAATNGAGHLAELGEIRAEVFGARPLDDTVPAFGIESGRPMLEAAFEQVEWFDYHDHLECTDTDDVLAFLRSVPPGEGASGRQNAKMEAAVAARFEAGGGTMRISKESGLFRCHGLQR